jgi:2-polyprenyl-3-methyl-5-hydroxy-6-metoxy-1,4-benzoquinol methylase
VKTAGAPKMASTFISRPCPVCESTTFAALFRKHKLHLVRCSSCGAVYVNPVEESLTTGEFYDRLATPFYLSPAKLESDYSPVRFERELKLFRRFCQGGRVLDVGCSTGAFLFQLMTRFPSEYDVTGVDVVGPALDHAEGKGVRVIRESYLKKDFQGATFSAVTFWAVLEHLLNPRAFLTKTVSVLEPGGFCFLLVPNFRSLAVRLLGQKYRYIFPQHLNYFTSSTLKQFVRAHPELQIVYASSTHFNPIVILQDFRSGGQFVSDEERAALLKRTTGYKQNPLLKPVKLALAGLERVLGGLNLADNLAVVAQKTARW